MKGAGYINYREAADFLGLSEFTIRRYVSQGRIPSKRVGMKKRFFDKQELLQWIESTSKERLVRRGKLKVSAETGNSNGADTQ